MGKRSPAGDPTPPTLVLRTAAVLVALVSLIPAAPALRPAAAASVAAAQVLGWTPGATRGAPLSAPISLYFNRPMDRASVVAAWGLRPAIPGRFSWGNASVTFTPSSPLKAGAYYRLSLGTGARAANGVPLRSPFAAAFSTGDPLRVQSYTPANGTTGVPANGLVAVTFNHPMVALAGLSVPPANPQGWRVSISPHLAGYGGWIGTSTWVFHPARGLDPSTRYTVTVGRQARDAWGDALGRDLSWSFRTLTPELYSRSPGNGAQFADPRGPVTVTFNQPMDHASTARALTVSTAGKAVAGTVSWRGTSLLFRPSSPLDSGVPYVVTVAASARAANLRAALGRTSRWEFRAAPLPKVTGTNPGAGGTSYQQSYGFYLSPAMSIFGGYGAQISFSTPMKKLSLDRRLTVSPAVSTFQTFFGGPDANGTFTYSIDGDFKPSSSYTVMLGNGVSDRFGRPLPGPFALHFKTAPLRPSVALYGMPGAGDGISFSAGRVVRAPVQILDVPRVRYTLIHTTLAALSRSYNGPPAGTTMRRWTVTLPAKLNTIQNLSVKLAGSDGSPLPPGLYWLGADTTGTLPGLAPADTPPGSSEIVLVSNTSITVKTGSNGTLAWAVSAQTGQPLAKVRAQLVNGDGTTAASTTIGADGTALFEQTSDGGPATVLIDDKVHFGLTRGYWTPNASSPTFLPFGPFGGSRSSNGTYLYTDRPLYRTGQTVHLRGMLWRDNDGVYSLLGPQRVNVQAWDQTGRALYHASLSLDRYGAVHGSFRLPRKASTGSAYISAGLPGRPPASTNFTVAEYRKPEFLTTVTPAAQSYVQGQTLSATVAVKYVFGAPVAHQRVSWTAYAQPQFPQPPGWDAYTFFDWETYWNQTAGGTSPSPPQTLLGTQVGQGSGTTDAQGKLVIHLPVDLAKELADRTLTVEATTTDINHQSVSGRTSVSEYQSAVAIGLSPSDTVVPAGQKTSVAVAAVRYDGTPVPGERLTARVLKRTYTSVLVKTESGGSSWQPVAHDTPVETQTLTTDGSGKATLSFTPAGGGEYVVTVRGQDAQGNVAQTAQSITATAAGQTDWGISSNTSIQLKPDRETYSVGDTAHVLVAAPFDGATALVTIERGSIRKHWVTHLPTNSSMVDLPVTLDDVPNVYVTVTVYRGLRGTDPPDWRYGVAELHVRLDPRHLIVHLAQNGHRHHPGDRVTYTVTTTDTRGRPVSAELSLALVDTAVLALQDEVNPDIMAALYSERPLGVTTGSDGVLSIDHLQAKPGFVVQPLGGPNGALPRPIKAPSTGGGGEFQQGAGVAVRANFADTAYWTGSLVTDAAGHAAVTLTLPDNATTWRLDARGVTAAQGVGQSVLTTLATKDLIVRPVTPRFLVQNDSLRIGATVNDNLGRPVSARISLAATGLRVLSAPAVNTRIPAHGERLLLWRVSVPESSSAAITVRAVPAAGVQGDAVRVTVPVHPPLTGETVATAGQVFGSTRQLVILPRHAVPRPGALTVQVSSSLVAGLGDAYGTFKPSPWESNEDVADRVLAAGSLHALPAPITGLTVASYRRLPLDIAAGVQKLLDDQYPDGGWPWFNAPFAVSDPQITADAVEALKASGEHGALVRAALSQGRAFVMGRLASAPAGQRTHLLRVLAETGVPPRGQIEALYHNSIQRSHLDVGPLSELGTALAMSRDAAAGRTIASTLDSRAVVSATGAHWEGSAWAYFAGPPIATTADALAMLLQVSPGDPFVPASVRWLMLARAGSAWDCPHDSAQAIAALSAYARAAQEGRASYTYRVAVGRAGAMTGQYTASNQRAVHRLTVTAARLSPGGPTQLVLTRGAPDGSFGSGPLYYLARLTYYLPAAGIGPRSQGISVSRRFTDLAGHTVAGVGAGSAVKVALTIHTEATLLYLHVDDPIPAGCEPIDSSLNTSQQGLFPRPQYFPWPGAAGPQHLGPYLTHTDLRDDRVDLYAYSLAPGTYTYWYLMQATVPGRYDVAPTHVDETFFPEVFGRSSGQSFVVR